jgi:hypothetical protein
MREEKKYEVLPGVEIPDMKKIQEAASDFSVSEVGEVEIRTITMQPVAQAAAPGVSSADLNQLQQLGAKVAENEAKAKAESREKMDKIMQSVKAPESIFDLKQSHIAQVDSKKRKELEESIKADEQQQAEEDAKTKAREERRQLQQRLLEESRERAAKEKAEKERLEKKLAILAERERAEKEKQASAAAASEEAKTEAKTDADKTEVKAADAKTDSVNNAPVAEQKPATEEKPKAPKSAEPEVKKTAKVVSDAEAFDDFKEFLEDDDK